jgi:hypothetical protein
MARALCELQLELASSRLSVADADSSTSTSTNAESENLSPKTLAKKESKKETRLCRTSKSLTKKFASANEDSEAIANFGFYQAQMTGSLQKTEELNPGFLPSEKEDNLHENHYSCQNSVEFNDADSCCYSGLQSAGGKEVFFPNKIGNFPSPKELASLDETFLMKRCNLGYRARRILKLAQSIVEGRIQLKQLEEVCTGASPFKYNELAEQLNEVDGFGPFTSANVLVCMGFYHVIPTDSETIRHLSQVCFCHGFLHFKNLFSILISLSMQVHAIESTTQNAVNDVERIYGKYAPFQFLAYWYIT